MNSMSGSPDNQHLTWLSILSNLGLALIYLINWVIRPRYLSEMVKSSNTGAIILISLAFIGTVAGIVIFIKAYRRGIINSLFDIIVYSILPIFAGVLFITLVMLVDENGTKKHITGDEITTYRIDQLEKSIDQEMEKAQWRISQINTELSTTKNNDRILLLEKEKIRLETVKDRLELLAPTLEDLANGISAGNSGMSRGEIDRQLKEYEKLIREISID